MRWLTLLICLASLPASAQEFTTFKGHGGPIMGLSVSPEGQVASASFDNAVGLWSDGQPEWLEGHDAAVVAIDYTQAPVALSGGDDFRLLLWSPGLDAPVEVTRHQGKVAGIAVSPDRTTIASAGWDGAAKRRPVTRPPPRPSDANATG